MKYKGSKKYLYKGWEGRVGPGQQCLAGLALHDLGRAWRGLAPGCDGDSVDGVLRVGLEVGDLVAGPVRLHRLDLGVLRGELVVEHPAHALSQKLTFIGKPEPYSSHGKPFYYIIEISIKLVALGKQLP